MAGVIRSDPEPLAGKPTEILSHELAYTVLSRIPHDALVLAHLSRLLSTGTTCAFMLARPLDVPHEEGGLVLLSGNGTGNLNTLVAQQCHTFRFPRYLHREFLHERGHVVAQGSELRALLGVPRP